MLSTIRNQRGISLMEIMVSVVVLSIAIVFLYHMLFGGRVLVEIEGERRMALKLAEHKIEELLYVGYGSSGPDDDWTSVNLDVGTHPADGTVLIDDRGTGNAGDDLMGTMSWTVRDTSYTDVGATADCKVVRVTVEWPLSSSRESVSVATLIGR